MRKITRGARAAVLWLTTAGGCSAQSGTALELTRVLAPDSNCTFTPSGNSLITGWYDPAQLDSHYQLVAGVRNHMETRDEAPYLGPNNQNERAEANNATVVGFDACWLEYQAGSSQSYRTFDSHGGGYERQCSELGGTAAFFPATGYVPVGGEITLTSVNVLRLPDLQAIWGSGFDPMAIPTVGFQTLADPDQADRLGIPSGDYYDPRPDTSVSTGWGTFPKSQRSSKLVLQLRAVAQLQSGHSLTTDWINFEIIVCPRCVQASCGIQPKRSCPAEVCSDGAVCTTGTCANGAACTPAYTIYGGSVASTEGLCDPFNGYSNVACESAGECD